MNSDTKRIIKRLEKIREAASPDSKRLRAALIRIGSMLEGEMKMNIRRQKLIDTGNMLNSTRYELFSNGPTHGVRIGPFGVPYARFHEFGTRKMRARPFVGPAVAKRADWIMDTLREAFKA